MEERGAGSRARGAARSSSRRRRLPARALTGRAPAAAAPRTAQGRPPGPQSSAARRSRRAARPRAPAPPAAPTAPPPRGPRARRPAVRTRGGGARGTEGPLAVGRRGDCLEAPISRPSLSLSTSKASPQDPGSTALTPSSNPSQTGRFLLVAWLGRVVVGVPPGLPLMAAEGRRFHLTAPNRHIINTLSVGHRASTPPPPWVQPRLPSLPPGPGLSGCRSAVVEHRRYCGSPRPQFPRPPPPPSVALGAGERRSEKRQDSDTSLQCFPSHIRNGGTATYSQQMARPGHSLWSKEKGECLSEENTAPGACEGSPRTFGGEQTKAQERKLAKAGKAPVSPATRGLNTRVRTRPWQRCCQQPKGGRSPRVRGWREGGSHRPTPTARYLLLSPEQAGSSDTGSRRQPRWKLREPVAAGPRALAQPTDLFPTGLAKSPRVWRRAKTSKSRANRGDRVATVQGGSAAPTAPLGLHGESGLSTTGARFCPERGKRKRGQCPPGAGPGSVHTRPRHAPPPASAALGKPGRGSGRRVPVGSRRTLQKGAARARVRARVRAAWVAVAAGPPALVVLNISQLRYRTVELLRTTGPSAPGEVRGPPRCGERAGRPRPAAPAAPRRRVPSARASRGPPAASVRPRRLLSHAAARPRLRNAAAPRRPDRFFRARRLPGRRVARRVVRGPGACSARPRGGGPDSPAPRPRPASPPPAPGRVAPGVACPALRAPGPHPLPRARTPPHPTARTPVSLRQGPRCRCGRRRPTPAQPVRGAAGPRRQRPGDASRVSPAPVPGPPLAPSGSEEAARGQVGPEPGCANMQPERRTRPQCLQLHGDFVRVWGKGSPGPVCSCGVTRLCKAQAHPCLGENLEGCQLRCQPGPGNQAEKPGGHMPAGWAQLSQAPTPGARRMDRQTGILKWAVKELPRWWRTRMEAGATGTSGWAEP
ncbi:collagen alpha-1(I) chain-like [Hyaena hyaena]|uniref:collagen alpha-1(I) chain-like n=1 Tax=Hyaena hyaena TaxID=95912 RepID=UPI0019205EFD|nr:collagen alpha-1(I) chain-like [Hyaena hyaena]